MNYKAFQEISESRVDLNSIDKSYAMTSIW